MFQIENLDKISLPLGHPDSKRIHWRQISGGEYTSPWRLLEDIETNYAIDLWVYLKELWELEINPRLPILAGSLFNGHVFDEIGGGYSPRNQFSNVIEHESLRIISIWKTVVDIINNQPDLSSDLKIKIVGFDFDSNSFAKAAKSCIWYLIMELGYPFERYPNASKIFNIKKF